MAGRPTLYRCERVRFSSAAFKESIDRGSNPRCVIARLGETVKPLDFQSRECGGGTRVGYFGVVVLIGRTHRLQR